MLIDQVMRSAFRDEIRAALAEERAATRAAIAEEVRKLIAIEFLTTAEAAELARVSPKTVRRWVDEGKLSRHYAGGDLRVVRSEFLAMLGCSPAVGTKDAMTDEQIDAKVNEMLGAVQ